MKTTKIVGAMKNEDTQKQREEEIIGDFKRLMYGYPTTPPSQSVEWRKIGDFFEQFSLYDQFQQSISSNQLKIM